MGRKIQVSLRVPEALHQAAKEYAEEIGSSLSVWINMAIAARVKNWKSPITGEKTAREKAKDKRYEGWFCEHGVHGDIIPVAECPHKRSTVHRKSWVHAEVRMGYDDWLREAGG